MRDLKEELDPATGKKRLGRTEDGDLATVTGAECCLQNLEANCRFVLNEFFLNTAGGIPFFEKVFKKSQYHQLKLGFFRTAIKNTEEVSGIKTIKLEQAADRTHVLSFDAFHESGESLSNNLDV